MMRRREPHHPHRYGELPSNTEMRELKNRKIGLRQGKCILGGKKFTDYSDVVKPEVAGSRASSSASARLESNDLAFGVARLSEIRRP